MKSYRDMSDEEWQMVAPLLPELRRRSELRARPLANTRAVLNGVLARVMQQLLGLASEGLYALMNSHTRVPTELPEGCGEHAGHAGHAIGIDPTRSTSVSGDARTVLVPRVPLTPAAPVEYVNDGTRRARVIPGRKIVRAQKTRLETSSLQPGFVLRHRFVREQRSRDPYCCLIQVCERPSSDTPIYPRTTSFCPPSSRCILHL